ncbi:MAG: hypothetical protein ACJ8F7_02095, partial [Gemmataceae bacterium]
MSRHLAAVLALAILGVGFAAEPPEKLTVPPRPVEGPKLPPGAIIIVSGNPQDALGKGDAVVLSPDEYRRLLDTIDQLRKQATPDRPEVPSKCRLSARVEAAGQQEIVKVHAAFEFFTTAAKTTVALGCRNSAAVAAALDDKLPSLQSSEAGYSVMVEAPGAHKLTLDLELSLTSRGVKGGERGFTLHLPGSPITLIDKFELPIGVSAARLGRQLPATTPAAPPPQTFSAKTLVSSAAGQPALALGPVDGIELFWDVPAAQKPADPLLRASGEIGVRVDETQVTTTARLTLRCLTGRATEWKILAPAGSEVSVEADSATDWDVSQGDDKSIWAVRAIGPGAEVLRVEVLTRTPRKAGPVPVGPYLLVGALRQEGVIRIGAPTHLRPRFSKPRSDVVRGEPEADGVLAFHYGSTGVAGGQTPWLFADAESMRGELRTQVTHQLTLTEGGWRLTTDVKATPIRTDLDHLDLDIPAAVQDLRATPPELVESVGPRRDLGPTRWQVRLAQPKKGEVHLKLEGFYPVPAAAHEASLPLPRVAQTFDRDGRVAATVPEKLEVRGQVFEWERERVNESGRPLETATGTPATAAVTVTHSPARVDLTWGAIRSALVVESVVDLTLDETTAVARHRLTLPPSAVARQLEVRPGIGPQPGAPHLIDGGRLTAREGRWLLDLPASPMKEQSVIFSYVTPLPPKESAAGRRRVGVGLYWPEGATRCETRLRLWVRPAATTFRPGLSEGPWEELPTEAVADRASLPALVLRGGGIDLPLELALTEVTGLTPAGLVAERVLIAATTAEAGRQDYL